jgi:hypothetical protein
MAVEFVIDIEAQLLGILGDLPTRQGAYSSQMLYDLVDVSMSGAVKKQSNRQTQIQLTRVFNKHVGDYTGTMQSNLADDSSLEWKEMAKAKAYVGEKAPTFGAQVGVTWDVGKGTMRHSVVKNTKRYTDAISHLTKGKRGYLKQMGITGRNDKELLQNIMKDFAQKLTGSLSGNMDNREASIRISSKTRTKYLKAKEELKDAVMYKLGEVEKHCTVCLAFADVIFSNIRLGPPTPQHTKCACEYIAVAVLKQ